MISLRNRIISAGTAVALLCATSGLTEALAAPHAKNISVIPTVTSVSLVDGVLMATGVATATINGQTTTVPFAAPVDITAAPSQAGVCPVLDLTLGPIHLNVLGLDVQTSRICLTITAIQGGGLLGQLLCGLGNLLNQGLTLNQILAGVGTQTTPALTTAQINQLLGGLANLLGHALANLNKAVLTAILPAQAPACSILHLELGPLHLNLLGLDVVLNNCANGAITVDITAIPGPGNLLGNLLCQLLGGNGINLGATLQQILNQILALLRGL
jgi:hypothetical protein